MDDRILKIMLEQHALISTLFLSFKDEQNKKPEMAGDSFLDFVWEVKKHFFAEEQAIFDVLLLEDKNIMEIVNRLRKEHVIMLDILEKAKEDLASFSGANEEEFTEILKTHAEIEEKDLYPELDRKLTDEEKSHIISHIEQIRFQ